MRLWRPLDTEAVETDALAAGEPEFFCGTQRPAQSRRVSPSYHTVQS